MTSSRPNESRNAAEIEKVLSIFLGLCGVQSAIRKCGVRLARNGFLGLFAGLGHLAAVHGSNAPSLLNRV